MIFILPSIALFVLPFAFPLFMRTTRGVLLSGLVGGAGLAVAWICRGLAASAPIYGDTPGDYFVAALLVSRRPRPTEKPAALGLEWGLRGVGPKGEPLA